MRSNDSIQYYDHHALQLGNTSDPNRATRLAPFLAHLIPESRVLDLGCGTGADLQLFMAAGHRPFGLDASNGMVREAQKSGSEVQAKNFLFWSPKAGEWNGVWANHSFQHLVPEEVQRIVASAFRGLTEGGVLGVIVPEGAGAFEDREGDLNGPSRWIHPYTENQLCSMIEQTGFKVVQVGKRLVAGKPEILVIARRI